LADIHSVCLHIFAEANALWQTSKPARRIRFDVGIWYQALRGAQKYQFKRYLSKELIEQKLQFSNLSIPRYYLLGDDNTQVHHK
jgi:hypothetical protein